MSYSADTKFLILFNTSSLLDEVNNAEIFTNDGAEAIILDNGDGYQMTRDQYLYSIDASLGITNAMTLTFSLLAKNPGLAKNMSGNLESMFLRFMKFGEGTIDPITGKYTPDTGYVYIQEKTLANNQNQLQIKFGTHTATTESYAADKTHHFWITWNGGTSAFKIFVDGLESVLTTSGAVPATMSLSQAGLWINYVEDDSAYNVMRHDGAIKDIAFFNSFKNTLTDIQTAVNFGIQYFADTANDGVQEIDFPIFMNDPTAVRVTDACSDGTDLYLSRTDGKILQGNSVLWQSKKDYKNPQEMSSIKKFGEDITVDSGYLKITNGTVRL
jgi:hypothetical protein